MNEKWSRFQEELLKEKVFAEIEVENTTPVIIGGYNTETYSKELDLLEGPRPTEIKGLWRWWARALVSGALYQKSKNITINEADREIARTFGGLVKGKLFPSKLQIVLKDIKIDKKQFNIGQIRDIPRLSLIARSRKDEIYYLDNVSFRILLISNGASEVEKVFAYLSLLISLIFSGLGAITNRAFGSLKIAVRKQPIYKWGQGNDPKNIIEKIYSCRSSDEIKKLICSLIDLSLSIATQYIGEPEKTEKKTIKNTPLVPSLLPCADESSNIFKIDVISCNKDVFYLLKEIGLSTLKSTYKRHTRASGRNIHTFILGLPRMSKIKYGSTTLRTGYVVVKSDKSNSYNVSVAKKVIDKEETRKLRRISSIGFSIIKNNTTKYVLIYGLYSKDLEFLAKTRLFHRGVIGKPGRNGYAKRVIDTKLDYVNTFREYNNLYNMIINKIKRGC